MKKENNYNCVLGGLVAVIIDKERKEEGNDVNKLHYDAASAILPFWVHIFGKVKNERKSWKMIGLD